MENRGNRVHRSRPSSHVARTQCTRLDVLPECLRFPQPNTEPDSFEDGSSCESKHSGVSARHGVGMVYVRTDRCRTRQDSRGIRQKLPSTGETELDAVRALGRSSHLGFSRRETVCPFEASTFTQSVLLTISIGSSSTSEWRWKRAGRSVLPCLPTKRKTE